MPIKVSFPPSNTVWYVQGLFVGMAVRKIFKIIITVKSRNLKRIYGEISGEKLYSFSVKISEKKSHIFDILYVYFMRIKFHIFLDKICI